MESARQANARRVREMHDLIDQTKAIEQISKDRERHNIVGDVMRSHRGTPEECGCLDRIDQTR